MTPQEEIALNGAIADALFGWDHKENGMWADPTGDENKLPPNYCDNSGLMIGLCYKLRRRGFDIQLNWAAEAIAVYTLSKAGATFTGSAERPSEAICQAIKAVIDANAMQ